MRQKITKKDQDYLDLIAQTIYDKKGENILVLDVRRISSLTEYFIIAEGQVERHVAAIARAIVDALQMAGLKSLYLEGLQNGDWVVIDFGHIYVHLFSPEMRDRYALEQIWKEGEIVNVKIKVQDE